MQVNYSQPSIICKSQIPASAIVNEIRSPSTQTRAAPLGSFYDNLLDCLALYQADAARIEKAYGLPAVAQLWLGYRSCPEPLTLRTPQKDGRDLSHDEYLSLLKKAHARLDAMSDDEFCDWLTYSKDKIEKIECEALESVSWRSEAWPLYQSIIEEELATRFSAVSDVAGAYTDDRLRLKLPARGLLVPIRRGGRIRAVACYPRAGLDSFFLLTSKGLPGGAKASMSIHIANGGRAIEDRICIVVGHTVEADALAWETGDCVVAANSFLPFAFLRELRLALPCLKGCAVSSALGDAYARALRENGLRVRLLEMEGEGNA